ncbi:MAG: DUF3048 C-terminal domain-containing protein [Anaerolineales bacterium]|nr:DUF3048 C-terminal domain-containing protein [Anaerolineales bacterium]
MITTVQNFKSWLKITILVCLVLSLPACNLDSPIPDETAPTLDPFHATIIELQGDVRTRQPYQNEFSPAEPGMRLEVEGLIRTMLDGRARLDLSSGTTIRIAPSTTVQILDNQISQYGLSTRLRLELGKLWIILNGGTLEVETPSGLASVRGSYMSVELLADGEITITCLEGNCRLGNSTGEVNITNGQTATITSPQISPIAGAMSPGQFDEWQQENPEAKDLVEEQRNAQPEGTETPLPQTPAEPASYGPDPEDFPEGFNPLTGQPTNNPSNLNLPAIHVAVSHFPAAASRPQFGLSFSPIVYEISIGDGQTRFLATYFGDFPYPDATLTGDCEVRTEPIQQTGVLLGNRVWADLDENGLLDHLEPGIGGICVQLFDGTGSNLLQTTTTDSNGFFAFNVTEGGTYLLEFIKPDKMEFTLQDVDTNDSVDSDIDPATRQTTVIGSDRLDLTWDAGMLVDPALLEIPLVDPVIGPVRSGRIAFMPIVDFFQGSCLVQAGADKQVAKELRVCANVFGPDAGAGATIDISRLEAIARENSSGQHTVDYSGNTFTEIPPAGGQSANDLRLFYSYLDQSKWVYDPISGSWLRYVDDSTKANAGVFHPDVDRLNGRRLHFENVMVMFVEHQLVDNNPRIIDLVMDIGERGDAYLFRDGMMYPIKWNTEGGIDGRRTVMKFQDQNGNPFPLKPGHTWIHIVNLGSSFYQEPEGSSSWVSRFYAP